MTKFLTQQYFKFLDYFSTVKNIQPANRVLYTLKPVKILALHLPLNFRCFSTSLPSLSSYRKVISPIDTAYK